MVIFQFNLNCLVGSLSPLFPVEILWVQMAQVFLTGWLSLRSPTTSVITLREYMRISQIHHNLTRNLIHSTVTCMNVREGCSSIWSHLVGEKE